MPSSAPRRQLGTLLAASLCLALSTPTLAHPLDHDTIEVTLSPQVRPDGIHALEIQARYPSTADQAALARLSMDKVLSNVLTSADRIELESARDASGSLTLVADDHTEHGRTIRSWHSQRKLSGMLTLRYHIAIDNQPNTLGAAPPFELRSDGPAVSGLLGTFLPLPDDPRKYRLAIHWHFAPGLNHPIGLSTLGRGDVETLKPLDHEGLINNFVMGGDLAHEPSQASSDGFFSVWQGHPPFDAHRLMDWTHQLYRYYLHFFQSAGSTYSIYLRPNLINAGGGVEVGKSFVGTFDDHTRVQDFRLTLAHEMVHTFVGALSGDDELSNSWFAEGLAVYYQRELPLQAGLLSREDYLTDLNTTAARYYTDRLNNLPNASIGSRFWQDTRVRVLPYDRGALYFAQVNAELRKASHGQYGLDDLLLKLLKQREAGKVLTTQTWLDAITQKLGSKGRSQFKDMLAGKLITLDSDTFGPDFRRISLPMRRYQLGFTPDVLTEPNRIVRGLISGSAAALAGLRNGDHIVKPVPQDALQGDQKGMLELHIERGGKPLTIRYLPRGESVATWQWVMTSDAQQSSQH